MPIKSILSQPPKQQSGSFAQNLRKRETPVVLFLTITFDGRKAWYVFKPEPAKAKRFLKIFHDNEAFSFKDYGEVLHYGWGEEPPADIKTLCREHYQLFTEDEHL